MTTTEHRMARCMYYGGKTKRTGRASSHCECPICEKAIDREKNEGVCACEVPTDKPNIMLVELLPNEPFDRFYCGCKGWD